MRVGWSYLLSPPTTAYTRLNKIVRLLRLANDTATCTPW
jgi:hypothetical protein